MIRRVCWSITTITQWVRSTMDSHRNRSTLHKLSFMWPINVNHDGPLWEVRGGQQEFLYSRLMC